MHLQAHFVATFSPEYTFFLDDKQRVQRVNGFSFFFSLFFHLWSLSLCIFFVHSN